MDWGAWSREAVAMMQTRTQALLGRHAVPLGSRYRWDLESATFRFEEVALFRLVTVGTVFGDSFLWAWANDSIPAAARAGIERVRGFGIEHDLALLSDACASGGLAQGKECLALAGRILDASGLWIDRTDAGHILFVLFEH